MRISTLRHYEWPIVTFKWATEKAWETAEAPFIKSEEARVNVDSCPRTLYFLSSI